MRILQQGCRAAQVLHLRQLEILEAAIKPRLKKISSLSSGAEESDYRAIPRGHLSYVGKLQDFSSRGFPRRRFEKVNVHLKPTLVPTVPRSSKKKGTPEKVNGRLDLQGQGLEASPVLKCRLLVSHPGRGGIESRVA